MPPLATGTPIVLNYGSTIGTTHRWSDGDTSTGGQGQTVDGLACGEMIETYHVHAHVSIFLNGDQLVVPKFIGLPTDAAGTRDPVTGIGKCAYSTHTHDETGEIHIEAAAAGTFTLGQVFDVWGQPLDPANVKLGDINGLPIKIYMFDEGETQATEFTGDPKTIELKAHRQITIQIGTAISTIPVYDFAGA